MIGQLYARLLDPSPSEFEAADNRDFLSYMY